MAITHKILVNRQTGKIIPIAYPIDDGRPEPVDCVWKEIPPGTHLYGHFCTEPPEDISHLSLEESYFDFQTNRWVEVPSPSVTKDQIKFNRNELLKISDKHIAEEDDPVRIDQWKDYRQKLRDLFAELPDDTDWSTVTFPRTPDDIAELKRKASEGDEDAAAIILRDGL